MSNEAFYLFLFACIQFTAMMDYLILMPLGVEISRVFGVGPDLFGLLVSSYCISAGVSGLVAALFLGHLPKTRLLTWIYAGFLVSTFLCGLAPTFKLLVLARCLTGVFGGLTAPVVLSLIGDLYPENKRGGAIGIFMLGFGFAAVVGVPLGLQLALWSSWRMPFFVVATLGTFVLLGCYFKLPKTVGVIREKIDFFKVVFQSPHLKLISIVLCLTFAQMVIMPYISPFLVKNAGVEYSKLPIIFGVSGVFALLSSPLTGKLSDRFGNQKIYTVVNLFAILVTLVFSFSRHLGLLEAAFIVALLTAFVTGRFVVAMAVFTSGVSPAYRTAVFSFNSAIQQLGTGLATYFGGLVLVEKAQQLVHFEVLGGISVAFSILTSVLLRYLTVVAFVALCVGLVPAQALAIDFTLNGSWLEQGEVRELSQQGLSDTNQTFDNYTLIDIRTKTRLEGFTLRIAPEVRGLVSKAVSLSNSDPAYLTVNSPARFLNTQRTIASGTDALFVADLDVMDLSYSTDNAEIYVGRRPVGIGVLKAIPIWNKFTKPLPTVSGYPLIFNPDMFGARYQFGQFATQAFQIRGASQDDTVSLLEQTYYGSEIEVHALESYWWDNWVVGLALVKDLGGLTLRSESLYIGINSTSENQFQTALEGEYALNAKWSMLGSLFLYSRGATSTAQYQIFSPTRFTPLHALAYGYLQLIDKQTALWTLSAADQVNWIDLSNYILLRSLYSVSTNFDFYVDVNFPLGRENSEFSSHTFVFSDGTYVGLPNQLDAGLKWFF